MSSQIIPVNVVKDSWKDGICDIPSSRIGNIGNALVLNNPTIQQSMAGVPALLWQDPSVAPANSSRTVIAQARANAPGNSRGLIVGINSITTQEQSFGTWDADLKAALNFGVGNDRNFALIDVAQGLQLGLVATNIEIQIIYTLLSAIGTVQSVMAGAQIGYGSRAAGPVRPTFTARFSNVAPNTSVSFIPPPFAREVYVSVIDQTTLLSVASTLRLLGNTPFQLGQYNLAAGDSTWRPLPNGATTVTIGNPAANPNNIQGAVIFGLAL